jgi:hypothetical protein
MNKTVKRIFGGAAALVTIGAFGVINAPAASAVGNFLHDLVIKHDSASQYTGSLTICKDWGTTSCGSKSPHGWLKRGANSKTQYGWKDADGFYKPAGYWSKIYYGPTVYNGCAGKEGKWCKLSGPGTKSVVLKKY